MNPTVRPWEESVKMEAVTSLMDFFTASFHMMIYYRMGYPKRAFFFSELFDTQIPICFHPGIAEYLEMCAKKAVSLLITRQLFGIEMHQLVRRETIERFVFKMDGEMEFDSICPASGDHNSALRKLSEMNRILKKNLLEFKINSLKLPPLQSSEQAKFKISIALPPHAAHLYKEEEDGIFQHDQDSEKFPWSKPILEKKSDSANDTENEKVSSQNSSSGSESDRSLKMKNDKISSKTVDKTIDIEPVPVEKSHSQASPDDKIDIDRSHLSPDMFADEDPQESESDPVSGRMKCLQSPPRSRSPSPSSGSESSSSTTSTIIKSKHNTKSSSKKYRNQAEETPSLTPLSSFTLLDDVFVNCYALTYVKSGFRDADVIRRPTDRFKIKDLNSPQNYRSDSPANAKRPHSSLSQYDSPSLHVSKKPKSARGLSFGFESPRSASVERNYDYEHYRSPKSSTRADRDEDDRYDYELRKAKAYRRPTLSSSRSVVENLQSAAVSPNPNLKAPHRNSGHQSPPISTHKSAYCDHIAGSGSGSDGRNSISPIYTTGMKSSSSYRKSKQESPSATMRSSYRTDGHETPPGPRKSISSRSGVGGSPSSTTPPFKFSYRSICGLGSGSPSATSTPVFTTMRKKFARRIL